MPRLAPSAGRIPEELLEVSQKTGPAVATREAETHATPSVLGHVQDASEEFSTPLTMMDAGAALTGLGAKALPGAYGGAASAVASGAGQTLGKVVAPVVAARAGLQAGRLATDPEYRDKTLNAVDNPEESGFGAFLRNADPANLPATVTKLYGGIQKIQESSQGVADSTARLEAMKNKRTALLAARKGEADTQARRQEIVAGGVGSPNKALSRMWPSSTPQSQAQGLDVPKQELTQPTKDTPSGTPSTPKPSWSSTPKPVETKFGSEKQTELREPVKRPRVEHDDVCPNCGEVIHEKGSWPLRTKAGKQVRLGDRLVERHSACGGNFLWPESTEELSPEWQGLRELGKASLMKDSVPYAEWLAEQPAEKRANVATDLQEARKQTETKPTEAQIEADNYRHGKIVWRGLTISLENPKGSTRSGTSKSGKKWSTLMRHDYGRFLKTEGADGDHMDTFVGPDHESEVVYVIDQDCPDTGKFDEAKIMICFGSEEAARQGYLDNYEKGWKGLGDITALTIPQLKWWLAEGQTTKPLKGQQIKAAAHEVLIGGGLGALAGALAGGLAAQHYNQEVKETGEGEEQNIALQALGFGAGGAAVGAAAGYGISRLGADEAPAQVEPFRSKEFFPGGKSQRELEIPDFRPEAGSVNPEKYLSHFYQHVDGGWNSVLSTARQAVLKAKQRGDWHVEDPNPSKLVPFAGGTKRFHGEPNILDLQPGPHAVSWSEGDRHRIGGVYPSDKQDTFQYDVENKGLAGRLLGSDAAQEINGFASPGAPASGRHLPGGEARSLLLGHEARHSMQTDPNIKGDPSPSLQAANIYTAGRPWENSQALGQLKAETAWMTGRVINTAGDFRQLMDETGVTDPDPQKFKEMQLKYSPEGARMLNYMRTLYVKDPAAYDKAIHEMGKVDMFRQVVMGEHQGDKVASARSVCPKCGREDDGGYYDIRDWCPACDGTKTATTVRQGVLDDVPITGPEAIQHALGKLDMDQLEQEQRQMLARKIKTKRGHAARVLGIIDGLRRNDVQPRDLMITKVPVLPAQFRPFSVVGETFTPGDANEMYKDLVSYRDMYSKSVKELGHEGSTDAWNGLRQALRAVYGFDESPNPKSQTRNVRGFLEHLCGVSPKESWFQRKLLSKPQDSVARGVIVPDPNLGMDEIGVPEEMLWPMYGSHIQRRMVRAGMSPIDALKHVRDRSETAKRALLLEMPERPVVYSRSPAWHRFNVLSGTPKMTDGHAIQLSPLVEAGLTADHDGNCVVIGTKIFLALPAEAVEISPAMKITGDTRIHLMQGGSVLACVSIEDTPHLPETRRLDKNGAEVYDVPPGIQVVTTDVSGKGVRFSPVTEFTRELGCELRHVRTSGKKDLTVSANESMAVLDSSFSLVRCTPEGALGQFIPVASGLPGFREAGPIQDMNGMEFGWFMGMLVSDGWISISGSTFYLGMTKADSSTRERAMLFLKTRFPDDAGHFGEYREVHVAETNGGIGGESVKFHWLPKSQASRDFLASLYQAIYHPDKYLEENSGKRSALFKRLPLGFVSYGRDVLLGMLGGFFAGDAALALVQAKSKSRPQVIANLGTSSPWLRDDFRLLCRVLGIETSYSSQEPKSGRPQKHTSYTVSISSTGLARHVACLSVTGPGAETLVTVPMFDNSDMIPLHWSHVRVLRQALREAGRTSVLASLAAAAARRDKRTGWFGVRRDILSGWLGSCQELGFLEPLTIICRDTSTRWERVTAVEPVSTEPVFDLGVPETKVFALANGAVIYDTINLHTPASHDAVEEAKTILKPSSMPFSIRNPDKLVPTLKHEQVLGLYDAANSPSRRTHKFADKEQALAAIRQGTVDLSDEIEIGVASHAAI